MFLDIYSESGGHGGAQPLVKIYKLVTCILIGLDILPIDNEHTKESAAL